MTSPTSTPRARTPRSKERRQRRIYAAIAGWALLGAASTGIVACSNADAATETTASSSSVAAAAATSSAATSKVASSSSAASSAAATTAANSSAAAPTSAAAATSEATTAAASTYADGIYTASGSYSSPGGTESVTITLTLTGDIITSASGVGDATSPPSSQYQAKFVDNFASLIVGKDIDEVSLDKVAGSSLTSGGFNAAVETIKSDALA